MDEEGVKTVSPSRGGEQTSRDAADASVEQDQSTKNVMFKQKLRMRAARMRSARAALDKEDMEKTEAMRQERARIMVAASAPIASPTTPEHSTTHVMSSPMAAVPLGLERGGVSEQKRVSFCPAHDAKAVIDDAFEGSVGQGCASPSLVEPGVNDGTAPAYADADNTIIAPVDCLGSGRQNPMGTEEASASVHAGTLASPGPVPGQNANSVSHATSRSASSVTLSAAFHGGKCIDARSRPLASVSPTTLLRGTSLDRGRLRPRSSATRGLPARGNGKVSRGAGKAKKRARGGKTARGMVNGAPRDSDRTFASLSLCAIKLGHLTKKTVAAWARELQRGGGTITTAYEPGKTTHVIVDVSLSPEALNRCPAWRQVVGEDGVTCADDGRPLETPIIDSAWLVECLKRSTVVSTRGFRLDRRPIRPLRRKSASPPPPLLPHPPPSRPLCVVATVTGVAAGREATETIGRTGMMRPAPGQRCKEGATSTSADDEPGSTAGPNGTMVVDGGLGGTDPQVATRKANFFCQSGAHKRNACNEKAARALDTLSKEYATRGEVWRERGFQRAAAVLRGLAEDITTFGQLKDLRHRDPKRLKGLGESVMKELEAFFLEGRTRREEGLVSDPQARALKIFLAIWGVGKATAHALYAAGFRTIEDVRAKGKAMLNRQQLVGLKRYDDLLERMPRSEAGEIEARVAAAAASLCPGVILQACGSYRRGKETCGDVDVLIRPPEGQEDCGIMLDLLDVLRSEGFLTDDLSTPRRHSAGDPQSYMGVCKLPGEGRKHRRVDIKLYPTAMYGFAVLYFTGSKHFNCSMRAYAKLLGLSLNDKELRAVNRAPNGDKIYRGKSYRCPREEDVFSALGLDWRDPSERDGHEVQALADSAERHAAGTLGQVLPGDGDSRTALWKAVLREEMAEGRGGGVRGWGADEEGGEDWEPVPPGTLAAADADTDL